MAPQARTCGERRRSETSISPSGRWIRWSDPYVSVRAQLQAQRVGSRRVGLVRLRRALDALRQHPAGQRHPRAVPVGTLHRPQYDPCEDGFLCGGRGLGAGRSRRGHRFSSRECRVRSRAFQHGHHAFRPGPAGWPVPVDAGNRQSPGDQRRWRWRQDHLRSCDAGGDPAGGHRSPAGNVESPRARKTWNPDDKLPQPPRPRLSPCVDFKATPRGPPDGLPASA